MTKKHFSMVKAEDDFMIHQETYRLGDMRPGLWPSEASVRYKKNDFTRTEGTCMRAAWYRSSGVMKPGLPSVGLIWKGHLGKQVEKAQIEKWKQMGVWAASNIKFYDREIIVSGEMDAIVKNPETGGLIGYEVKSFYGHPANMLICGAKRDGIPGQPRMHQFLQSCVYAYKFREEFEEYRLMYIERGDGHRVEFEVGFETVNGKEYPFWQQIEGPYWSTFRAERVVQAFTMEEVHDRYKKLVKYLQMKKLPPRDYPKYYSAEQVEILHDEGEIKKTAYEKYIKNPGKYPLSSWNCSYCQYADQCEIDDQE